MRRALHTYFPSMRDKNLEGLPISTEWTRESNRSCTSVCMNSSPTRFPFFRMRSRVSFARWMTCVSSVDPAESAKVLKGVRSCISLYRWRAATTLLGPTSAAPRSKLRRRMNIELKFLPNFERLGLGCSDPDFCKSILVGKLLTRFTRCTYFYTAQISKFQQRRVQLFY